MVFEIGAVKGGRMDAMGSDKNPLLLDMEPQASAK
jgi:hypothetical protein